MEKSLYEIVEKISKIPVEELNEESELFESKIISSLGLLELVDEIERFFHVEILPEELLNENFSTIGKMKEFVTRKIQEKNQ